MMLPGLILGWLPLVVCVHRGAAFLAPVVMACTRPAWVRDTYAWCFVGWAALSLMWTPEPTKALHVAGCIALFGLIRPTRSWSVPTHYLHGVVVMASVVQILLIFFGVGHKNAPLLYAPVALTLSLLCAVYPTWVFMACSLWVGWFVDCDTAILATLGVGIARCMPLSWLKRMWKVLWVGVCLGLVGIYHLSDQHIQRCERFCPFSYIHRLYIYRETGKLVLKAPMMQKWRGAGLDASRFVGQNLFVFGTLFDNKQNRHTSKIIPVHPHNIVLQIIVELGWIGLVLASLCMGRMTFHRKEEVLVMYVAACQALVSVGIWQTWWMASVWLAYWLACMKAPDDA